MKRRTKIVCTLGPAVDSREKLKGLIEAGMNVARINCSHGDWETRKRWIETIRELQSEANPIGILVDLQGPKFRVGAISGGEYRVEPGKTFLVGPGPEADVPILQPEILAAMSPGGRLLLGDGEIELKLGAKIGANFEAKSAGAGILRSHKGVTLVGKVFETSCLTDKDLDDIQQAMMLSVDFVALSYVQNPSDMRELRRVIERLDPSVALCAKIETRQAVKQIDDIIKVSDAIMVARGDMGLQMEIEEVPVAQKRIIERCAEAGVPVITATQMLESMIHSPRPTRAEATDVANAILDGTDALMLSGETASGDYPLECVKTMAHLAERAEPLLDRRMVEQRIDSMGKPTHTEAVAHAVNELAKMIKPGAIVTTTTSGQTARLVSKFRPKVPILCATWNDRTRRQMALVWGVEAAKVTLPKTTDENISGAIDAFLKLGRLRVGDHVIVTAGVPAGVAGNTNLILTQLIS